MSPETILFYVFAFGALVTSGCVVFMRNPLMSALALIVDFFFFAGLYVLLSAHFMAVIQILVYGGAIMVLFMFIIMLLNLKDHELEQVKITSVHQVLAVVAAASFCGMVAFQISGMFDHEAIQKARAEHVQNMKDANDPHLFRPAIQSKVGHLAADFSEDALQKSYHAQLSRIDAGDYTDLDAKFPRDQRVKPKLPPVFKGLDHRGSPLPKLGQSSKATKINFGTAESVSVLLVNRFVIPFELTAILLLAAIVGAVIIAKKRL